MAWISVDQKLRGGRLRSLHKALDCSRHEAIGILIELWLWCIENADEDGLLQYVEEADIELAIRDGLADGMDPAKVVAELIESGWIIEDGGKYYVYDWSERISYFDRYNREKEQHSERMKRYRSKKESSDVTCDVTKKASARQRQESKYGPDFEEFWAAYPRKADKGQAFKKYQARRKEGFSAKELLDAAKNYSKQCEFQETETQYIKYAKTFLSDSLPFAEFIKGVPEPETNKKKNGFNNFDQRSDTDYEAIQSRLLKKSFEQEE